MFTFRKKTETPIGRDLHFNRNIARAYGLKEAILAQYIYDRYLLTHKPVPVSEELLGFIGQRTLYVTMRKVQEKGLVNVVYNTKRALDRTKFYKPSWKMEAIVGRFHWNIKKILKELR